MAMRYVAARPLRYEVNKDKNNHRRSWVARLLVQMLVEQANVICIDECQVKAEAAGSRVWKQFASRTKWKLKTLGRKKNAV